MPVVVEQLGELILKLGKQLLLVLILRASPVTIQKFGQSDEQMQYLIQHPFPGSYYNRNDWNVEGCQYSAQCNFDFLTSMVA